MTSLLQNKTKEDYASEFNLVEQGGENLVLSLGNLLNSAAQKASVIRQAEISAEKRAEVNMSCIEPSCFPEIGDYDDFEREERLRKLVVMFVSLANRVR